MTTSLSSQPQQILRADQAKELRELVSKRRDSASAGSSDVRQCHSIAISGGKGGVGRSVIALNLAIGLAQRGAAVGLVDASQDLGSVELLCGLNSYWNLSHVVQGSRQVSDIIQTGPGGIRILTGASCLADTEITQISLRNKLLVQLKAFEQELDWLIIDGGSGASGMTQKFALAADDLVVVTTPEPTAVAEAYSSIKGLAKTAGPRLGLLVNQAESAHQAQRILDQLQHAAHSFLRIDLHRRGYLPHDHAVQKSVNGRTPFVLQSPQSSVSNALFELIQRWTRPQSTETVNDYFSRLLF
jgi:flagellar biosynthesis protein FlhG